MTYLDTNILVRVITGDNPELAHRALKTIQAGAQNDFTVLDAVLVEACFILEFHDYKMARTDIADALQTLLNAPQIARSDVTLRTLKLYKQHLKLDYVDCLLFVKGGKNGVFTFDGDLRKTLLN